MEAVAEAVAAAVAAGVEPFPAVDKCDASGREAHAVAADLEGTLLRSRSAFPYYALVAFECGGVPRLALLLLLAGQAVSGSYDCCYASTFSRPPPPPPIAASTLDKAPMTSTDHGASTNTSAATPAANNKPPPPVAATATTLGKKGEGKGKAPTTTSTDHAGSTNTSAPPAANYQPPPLQGTQHVFASGVVVGHEDEEGYLVVDEVNTWRNTQQLVLEDDDDDDDDGRAAGAGAGEGGASASGR
uniref:Glycerol-3-phosphate acyltransferase RAM2/GPAT1-8 HAD-like domain-containing protein n=1 Tax=Oryza glumipatula TaxID=40148 RepID=A0A0E0BAG0_9ORYZ